MPSLASDDMTIQQFIRRLFRMGAIAFCGCAMFGGPTCGLAADVKVETAIAGLQEPVAIAVRPNGETPSEIYVADRAAGRVVKFGGKKRTSNTTVIDGFPIGAMTAKSNPGSSGLSALLFLDASRLVASGGNDNEPFAWLFDLSTEEKGLSAEDRKQEVEVDREGVPNAQIRSLTALVRTKQNDRVPDALFAAAANERQQFGLCRIAIRANTLSETGELLSPKSARTLGGISAMTVSKEGYVVVACDHVSSAEGSTLAFLSPIDGSVLLQIELKLPLVSALAFDPSSGELYAASAAEAAQGGGIYRLDDAGDSAKPACKAVKITGANRPTAMAFSSGGMLYVATLGEAESNTEASGTVLEITGF